MNEFDFNIQKHMKLLERDFVLNQDDKNKMYTFFKWNLQSLSKRKNEETFEETIFRTTAMTYIATSNKEIKE